MTVRHKAEGYATPSVTAAPGMGAACARLSNG